MKQNDLVTFKQPTAAEIDPATGQPVVFKVLEMRGPRVLVQSTDAKRWSILPTSVYLQSDLIVTKEA